MWYRALLLKCREWLAAAPTYPAAFILFNEIGGLPHYSNAAGYFAPSERANVDEYIFDSLKLYSTSC
jgi:hypothetical protein